MTMNIICRKCGDNHLTIKCKNKNVNTNLPQFISETLKKSPDEQTVSLVKPNPIETTFSKQQSEYRVKKFKNYNSFDDKNSKKYPDKSYQVKISDLPCDITQREILDLLEDWGDIVKLKVFNYIENSIVYIDFKYEEQANYFVNALNKTNFEFMIISVSRVK
jgi:RNA recognition motif-containing protein